MEIPKLFKIVNFQNNRTPSLGSYISRIKERRVRNLIRQLDIKWDGHPFQFGRIDCLLGQIMFDQCKGLELRSY